MSDRNYYGEALNIVWDSNRGDTVLNLLLAAQDEISMFRTGLDAANARAEAAETARAQVQEYLDTANDRTAAAQQERDQLRADLAAAAERVRELETALAAVPDYAAYAADVWQSSQFPQPFTEWLAAQPEVQP